MKLDQISIDVIKGTNKATIEKLKSLDIYSIKDLFLYLPKKYETYDIKEFNDIIENKTATIKAKIISKPVVKFIRPKLSVLNFHVVTSDQNTVKIGIFNRDFLRTQINIDSYVYLTGRFNNESQIFTATKFELNNEEFQHIKPVYGTKLITDQTFLKLISKAYGEYYKDIEDEIPRDLLAKYSLITKRQLVKISHNPANENQLNALTRRVKYEELFKFQLKLQYMKLLNKKKTGIEKEYKESILNKFKKTLNFDLTSDQEKTVKEILNDIKSDRRMNRLVQGDVGSGKTIVAAIASLATISAGFQVAFMAPTEILAEQHYEKMKDYLNALGINVVLLTGSIKLKDRKTILEDIKSNKANIMIGTHALIAEAVVYNKLGLVITDEQHRFGVNQRRLLKEKAISPDSLFLTATPIPRTLAITLFGDMDVSTIKELPNGRKTIKTKFYNYKNLDKVYELLEECIKNKNQAYVVAPLIESSLKLDLKNIKEIYDELIKNLDSNIKIGLLHGKMTSIEKNEIMKNYLDNKIDILVSTTVIEVGVDVKNATLMVIMDAHRFGLSQLHQLRGRVGRNDLDCKCIVMSDRRTKRLKIIEEVSDGFQLSEEDLKLRGHGDFFGNKQSGFPDFKMANLISDYKILEIARNDASELVYNKLFYKEDQYRFLREYLRKNIDCKDMD